jgi:hypothetical protein
MIMDLRIRHGILVNMSYVRTIYRYRASVVILLRHVWIHAQCGQFVDRHLYACRIKMEATVGKHELHVRVINVQSNR